MEILIEVTGVDAAILRLQHIRERIRAGCERAVRRSMDVVEVSIKGQLRLKSHPPRTPTPSLAGEPPALITGYLMRSVFGEGPYWAGVEVYGLVLPKAVYARIHELGGITGAGHRTVLPPRPYVTPGAIAARVRVREIFDEEISRAVEGA